MHWRHRTLTSCSDRLYKKDAIWKYKDEFFDDYYTPDAPMTLKTFGLCSRAPNRMLINRCVEKYVFHYVLSGHGWCNGIPIETGDVVFCSKSHPYNLSSDKESPCTMAWISFDGGKSEKYLNQMGITQKFLCYKTSNFTKIVEILYDMMEVEHADVDEDLYLEACFINLLSLSIPPENVLQTEESSSRKNKTIATAIQYIADHFREPELNITKVAQVTDRNEKYLQRIFKEQTGLTVGQYVSQMKIDAATTLLNSSEYNINQIADYVGYNDYRTFFTAFKKQMGCSPSQYIKSNNN